MLTCLWIQLFPFILFETFFNSNFVWPYQIFRIQQIALLNKIICRQGILMNLFGKIIMQKHDCLKSHICISSKCPNSYSFICDNFTYHDSHKNHSQSLLTTEQFLSKIEQYKQYSKFENKIVTYTINDCLKKMSLLNSIKALVNEKQNQAISNLSKIQQCFHSSIEFQKNLSSNIFSSENSSVVFQMLKQNLQFNLNNKCFVDLSQRQPNDNESQKFATIHEIEQYANANKQLMQEIKELHNKMSEQISNSINYQAPQQQFEPNQDEIQLWQSQQKCYKDIQSHLQQYSKDFRKQLEGRFDILSKTKKAISEFKQKNQSLYESIDHLVEIPPVFQSPMKKKMRILSSFSMQKQRQSFFSDTAVTTSKLQSQSKTFSLYQSPKLNRLELISGNQYEEMYIMLQLQKNQIQEELTDLKNQFKKIQNLGTESNNKLHEARLESVMKDINSFKQEIKRIRNDNRGVKQQIHQQICNYVEQYYQDQIQHNNSILQALQSILNCKRQQIVKEIATLKEDLSNLKEDLSNLQKAPKQISQPEPNLKQKIRELERQMQEKEKENSELRKCMHETKRASVGSQTELKGTNPQVKLQYQQLLHQSKKRYKQNQSLIQRLKQLQKAIEDRDKQILNLQKLKISNNVSKQYDEQLRINKNYYQNQVFLAHEENQKLTTKIKYLKNKIDNLNSFYSIQSQKIFEAQGKGRYLQSQLQEAAWQKYILIDKNNALQKQNKTLKRNLEKYKDKFYVLKGYAADLQKNTKQQAQAPQQMITSVIDQRIDLNHFDVQYSTCDSPLKNPNQLRVSPRIEQHSPNMDMLAKIYENINQLEQSRPLDSFLKIQPVKLIGSDVLMKMNQEQQHTQRISVPPILIQDDQSRDYEMDRSVSLKDIRVKERRFVKKTSFGGDLEQQKGMLKKMKTERSSNNQKKTYNTSNYTINISEPIARKQKKLTRNQSSEGFKTQFNKQQNQSKAKGLMFINQLLRKQNNADLNLSRSFKMK